MHLASQKIIVIWRLAPEMPSWPTAPGAPPPPPLHQYRRSCSRCLLAMLMMLDNVTLACKSDEINLIPTFLDSRACMPTLYPRLERRIMRAPFDQTPSFPRKRRKVQHPP